MGAAEIVKLIQGRILKLWRPTILVTSHNLSEIERLCHRVALMHRGRLAALGTIDEMRASIRQSDRYVMTVRGLDAELLSALAEQAGGLVEEDRRTADNVVEIEVSFALGSDGFPRLVRALVEKGGDLLSSSNHAETFDQVFHAVIEAENSQPAREAS